MSEDKPMGRPRKNQVKIIEINGEHKEAVEAIVKTQGKTSGGVYLPADWIGCRVICIKID